MKNKEKNLLIKIAPEAGVIGGVIAGHYLLDIPVWGLGVIALVVLAGKTYWQSIRK